MKETSCALIKDILPLYMEHLTSQETNDAVEEHLDECKSCQDLYDSMKEEMSEEISEEMSEEKLNKCEDNEVKKEVDYLKKIRNNARRQIWIAVGAALLCIVIIFLIKTFAYGTSTKDYVATISIEDNKIKVQGYLPDASSVYSHYKIIEKDGKKQLIVYAAKESILNNKGTFEIKLDIQEAKDMGLIVADQKITKSGTVISEKAAKIFENKHSYIGDMPKNNELANAIGIGEDLGAYTNELQTTNEPYRWTFCFQAELEQSKVTLFNEKMRGYAYVLLASVDNVDEISWSYMIKNQEGVKQQSITVTSLEATDILSQDIKSIGESEESIDLLLVHLGFSQVENRKSQLWYDLGGSKGLDGKSQLKEYKFRLILTGRTPNDAKDSTFVVLTNNRSLTFQEVVKSLFSSNTKDCLEDTVIVSWE